MHFTVILLNIEKKQEHHQINEKEFKKTPFLRWNVVTGHEYVAGPPQYVAQRY